jgi:hypothetical protein
MLGKKVQENSGNPENGATFRFTSILKRDDDLKDTMKSIENFLASKTITGREKLRKSLMLLKDMTLPESLENSSEVMEFKEKFIGLIERHFPSLFDHFRKFKQDYKPFIKLLQIFDLMLANFKDEKLISQRSDLIKRLMSLIQGKLNSSDWRSLRKLYDSSEELNYPFNFKEENLLVNGFLQRLESVSQALIWRGSKMSEKLAESAIKAIFSLSKTNPKKFNESLMKGRFERKDLNIEGSLVLGDEGGIYMLINSAPPGSINEAIILEAGVPEEFLKEKRGEALDKVTLGEGSFGKVRFALSVLGDRNVDIGHVICVKKSQAIVKEAKRERRNSLASVSDSTLEDFFAIKLNESIFAPKPLDMAILTNKLNKENHRKGYLFMELVPQNTANKVLFRPEYQKWEYQKPYILRVMKTMINLLIDNRILNTDLKPENTLFDPIARSMAVIDLGSSLYIEKHYDLHKFDASVGGFGVTQPYCPPEILDENQNESVDLKKAISLFMRGHDSRVDLRCAAKTQVKLANQLDFVKKY